MIDAGQDLAQRSEWLPFWQLHFTYAQRGERQTHKMRMICIHNIIVCTCDHDGDGSDLAYVLIRTLVSEVKGKRFHQLGIWVSTRVLTSFF